MKLILQNSKLNLFSILCK